MNRAIRHAAGLSTGRALPCNATSYIRPSVQRYPRRNSGGRQGRIRTCGNTPPPALSRYRSPSRETSRQPGSSPRYVPMRPRTTPRPAAVSIQGGCPAGQLPFQEQQVFVIGSRRGIEQVGRAHADARLLKQTVFRSGTDDTHKIPYKSVRSPVTTVLLPQIGGKYRFAGKRIHGMYHPATDRCIGLVFRAFRQHPEQAINSVAEGFLRTEFPAGATDDTNS